MFFHMFIYDLKIALRTKQVIFWLACFPAILGTLFYVAFGNIYSEETFEKIPVAVVTVNEDSTFDSTIEQVSKGKDGLFKVTRTDKKKAEKLLEKGKVEGIIFVDDELSLKVRSEGIDATIISTFLDRYTVNRELITGMIKENPLNILRVNSILDMDMSPRAEHKRSGENQDPYVQYFYNLLAMSCLFGAMGGVDAVNRNQANASAFGARICSAPVSPMTSLSASLAANGLVSFICNFAALCYLAFVLRIKFGVPFPMMLVIILFGCLNGLALGQFVGVISKNMGMAIGIVVAVSMACCFLSGLMIGNMFGIVQLHAPWFNRVNPAALLEDCFYSLNIYGRGPRFISDIMMLFGETLILMSAGSLIARRKRYAAV